MAGASLQISYDELRENVGLRAGYNRLTAHWTSEMGSDCALVLRSGLRKFYTAYQWSFLTPRLTIATSAPYATGTVTVVAGAVTGSGTAFPIWSTSGIMLLGGESYVVATYTDATHITLEDTSAAFAAGTTFELRRSQYTLPAGFAGLTGPLTYSSAEALTSCPVTQIDDHHLRLLQQGGEWSTLGAPTRYSTYPKSHDPDATTADTSQEWYIAFWPTPDDIYHLAGKCKINPYDLDATDKYPPGSATHSETILASVLSEVECKILGAPGADTERYVQLLQQSVQNDQRIATPETLGILGEYGQDSTTGYYETPAITYTRYTHLIPP